MTPASDKIVPDRDALLARLPAFPRPVVFTNGCFDLLHRGHVTYLEEAASFGRTLLVAVNSDDSVRRLNKGSGRPFNALEDRMAVLAALASVSLVVPFEEDDPGDLVAAVRPDHLVKGGDWPIASIVGAELVSGYGGQVHSLPFRYTRSTSDLIDRIRRASAAGH